MQVNVYHLEIPWFLELKELYFIGLAPESARRAYFSLAYIKPRTFVVKSRAQRPFLRFMSFFSLC